MAESVSKEKFILLWNDEQQNAEQTVCWSHQAAQSSISVAMRRLQHHSCLAEVSYPLGVFYLEEAALSNPS